MVRVWTSLLLLCGCDKILGIRALPDAPPPPDAAVDAPELDARINIEGCADFTREGFPDIATYPALAACAGAWSVPGLRDPQPMCNRAAGNDGANVLGTGCSSADLCATSWHVCASRLDVLARLPSTAQSCAGLFAAPSTFFATGQSGPGGGECDALGTNDAFGCGTHGPIARPSCAPLDRGSDNMCFSIKFDGGWQCPDPSSEITTITKTDPTIGGGVLCCRDTP